MIFSMLREGPPENQAENRHLAGEKNLIFDLIPWKERWYIFITKSKILAWSDHPKLSYEVHLDTGVQRAREKRVSFCTSNVVQNFPKFRTLTLWWLLQQERASFFLSDHAFLDILPTLLCRQKGSTKYFFFLKNP